MSPSSLIFVVVLAIWATYLTLHVARRREQMSTARSVDRFSSHMRVLQRRSVKGAGAEEAPSSGHTRASILTAGALEEEPTPASGHRPAGRPAAGISTTSPAATAASSVPAAAGRPARGQAGWDRLGAVRSNRVFAAWGGLTGLLDQVNPRRLRAYALLAFLIAGGVSFVVAATGRGGWLLPALCFAGVFGMLAWLRHDRLAVLAARDRKQQARRSEGERARLHAQRVAAAEADDAARRAAEARPEAGRFPVAQEHAPQRPHAAYDFFDIAAFDDLAAPATPAASAVAAPAPVATEAAPAVADDRDADTLWEPVPVPPPTYTLKARAEHPLPPAIPVAPEPASGPVPIEVEDDYEDLYWGRDAVGS